DRTLSRLRSQYFEAALRTGRHPVVLYLHGNGGTRSTSTRIPLYRLLSESPELDRHVIAVDYRGYGDSTPPNGPSERGVVRDALATYAWLAARMPPNAELIIWGHSLGTGISLQMLRKIQRHPLVDLVKGVVLEAPFNNMPDAVREYPLTMPFRRLPWFEATIMRPLANRFPFNSDVHIKYVRQPILILHAPDDRHVPICLGERLRDAATSSTLTKQRVVKFLNVGNGYGHVDIVRYPGLVRALRDFEDEYRDYSRHAQINL
ncbi:LOW QUALITY PROTEIN: monoacylglycerol lipase ABHD12-like, partial [Ctenocephalides felis]|uniref:LOW QUALITY PROTEIN: monoacylglycerol lipase ABHD12-like n=1 Tax=Ctenocephalides felis TaxID=7515 RepID=UPI000E6E2CEC